MSPWLRKVGYPMLFLTLIALQGTSQQTQQALSTEKRAEPKAPTAAALWADLKSGNRRFISGNVERRSLPSLRNSLVMGQQPRVIVLACADSRVAPEIIFDKSLGDLFVVRTAGNIADEIALGSIEYAIHHLQSKLLVVLGHEKCGGVAAAMSGEKMPTKNLQAIVDKIRPAFRDIAARKHDAELARMAVAANVMQSAEDIVARSPIVRGKVESGALTIRTAVYALESGEVIETR